MPIGRITYKLRLLEILNLPFDYVIMLTTYRKKWIPDYIWDNHTELEGKKALFVCVDAEKRDNKSFKVKRFIPLREVQIIKVEKKTAEREEYLNIWIKTGGYLRYKGDLDSFKKELETKVGADKLPPNEKSYIHKIDLDLHEIEIIKENEKEVDNAWMSLVEILSETEAYRNLPFFRIKKIVDSNSREEIYPTIREEKEDNEKRVRTVYDITAHSSYRLTVQGYFLDKAYENAPLRLDVSSSSPNIEVTNDLNFESWVEEKDCTITPKKAGKSNIIIRIPSGNQPAELTIEMDIKAVTWKQRLMSSDFIVATALIVLYTALPSLSQYIDFLSNETYSSIVNNLITLLLIAVLPKIFK